jgi:hypothetical protein
MTKNFNVNFFPIAGLSAWDAEALIYAEERLRPLVKGPLSSLRPERSSSRRRVCPALPEGR